MITSYRVFLFVVLLVVLACNQTVTKQVSTIVNGKYEVIPINKLSVVDGLISATEGTHIPWSPIFGDMITGNVDSNFNRTSIKLGYSKERLFILGKLTSRTFGFTRTKRDDYHVYKDDCFELFLDPDSDGKNYFEIQINPAPNICDLQMTVPYNSGGKANYSWDAIGVEVASVVDGQEGDQTWLLELSIPWTSFDINKNDIQPGFTFKGNFAQIDYEGNETSFYSLAPQYKPNMHLPEKWIEFMLK